MFRKLRIVAVATIVLPWLGMIVPAEAAKIRMMNCTGVEVKVCAEEYEEESFKPEAIRHFTCNSRCTFQVTECVGNKCGSCKELDWDQDKGEDEAQFTYKLQGKWSKGNYSLVGLETKKGSTKGEKIYLESNLVKLDDSLSDSTMYCPQ